MDIEEPVTASASETKNDYLLPGSILVAALLISGSIVYLVRNGGGAVRTTPPGLAALDPGSGVAAPDSSDRDVILGDPDAPVTIIEFGDYQCPFCAMFFTDVEPKLRAEYLETGKAKMVFRNFQFLGPESAAAAEAAECAKDQNQFWAYHDALYTLEGIDGREHNGNLNRGLFLKIAGDLKLDTAAFASCIDGGTYAETISDDRAEAATYGVNSTPTTFVNGRKVTDAAGNSVGANATAIFSFIDAALEE